MRICLKSHRSFFLRTFENYLMKTRTEKWWFSHGIQIYKVWPIFGCFFCQFAHRAFSKMHVYVTVSFSRFWQWFPGFWPKKTFIFRARYSWVQARKQFTLEITRKPWRTPQHKTSPYCSTSYFLRSVIPYIFVYHGFSAIFFKPERSNIDFLFFLRITRTQPK